MIRNEVVSTRVTGLDRLLLEDHAARRDQTLSEVIWKRLVPWVRLEALQGDLLTEHSTVPKAKENGNRSSE